MLPAITKLMVVVSTLANILPLSDDLSESFEGSSIDVTFTAQLTANDTLVSINIIDYENTPGVTVDLENLRVYGTYDSVFALGDNALQYREGDELKATDSWDKLPGAPAGDLFLWKAPEGLRKRFNYIVELVYIYTPPTPPPDPETGGTTDPGPPVQMTLTKTYFKDIIGDYSRWAEKLRAYVYARP